MWVPSPLGTMVWSILWFVFIETGCSQLMDINRIFSQGPPKLAPKILNSGERIRVRLGDNTTLPCVVQNFQTGYTAIWRRGENAIMVGQMKIRLDLRISLVEQTSLLIKGADTLYSGNYTCEIEWSENEPPPSITHYLEVQVPPSVFAVTPMSSPNSGATLEYNPIGPGAIVEVVEGDNATLECRAEGIPRPALEWTSEMWAPHDRRKAFKLELVHVLQRDEGEYLCTAYNGVGPAVSDNILLRVQHVPIVHPLRPIVKASSGDKSRLTCHVKAKPQPNVVWYFGENELRPDSEHQMEERGDNYTLVLRNIEPKDLGNYTCLAINKIGESRATVNLSGIPHKATITSPPKGRHRSSYDLTWSIKSFAPILETEVRYKPCMVYHFITDNVTPPPEMLDPYSSSTGFQSPDHAPSSSESSSGMSAWSYSSQRSRRKYLPENLYYGLYEGSYLFEPLRPDCEHEVRLRARNKFGWSDEEVSFVFWTSKRDPSPQKISSSSGNLWSNGGLSSHSSMVSMVLACYVWSFSLHYLDFVHGSLGFRPKSHLTPAGGGYP
ncbi:lachesin-like [Tigriopus californicus]|uniref:lachesin-like n=1 Tax=Tigriopus californicus TaxID=6832 RepID=UPI0027DAB339|nr:lachesin-like [Tigriopus californicus]